MSSWTPSSALAKAVLVAGFEYDPEQDIIFSIMNPLQRKFGYAYGYDVGALLIHSVIDSEPIFFDYGGKSWMIELWKGQYGLETGAEIGIYSRSPNNSTLYSLLDATVGAREHDPIPSHNLFYDCGNDNELLEMSFTLYRNGLKLFSRGPEMHWWLTGFKWGVLSRPEDLSMDLSIKFPAPAMLQAFVGALKALGYHPMVSMDTVRFTFDQPRTFQPYTDGKYKLLVDKANFANQEIVSIYQGFGLPNNDPNTVPEEVADIILESINQYYQTFFAQTVADLFKAAGKTASELIDVLSQKFEIAKEATTEFIAQAGYQFSEWIDSLEQALGLRMNFSCAVEICSTGNSFDLIRQSYEVTESTFPPGQDCGHYVVKPPERIPAGGIGRFWLQDYPGPHGAEGSVRYTCNIPSLGVQKLTIKYGCPTGNYDNYCDISGSDAFDIQVVTKAGDTSGDWKEKIVKRGHPFHVRITILRQDLALPTPVLTAPADGAKFSNYPRTMTLAWQSVPGANQYLVEVEYAWKDASGTVTWGSDLKKVVSDTQVTFDFVGSQPGRWRITAMDQSGAHKSSVPSNWRGFDYTVLPVLPTPVLTAPADGAKFSNYPRTMTLAWQSVPGANQYLVEVEYAWKDASGTVTWGSDLKKVVSDTQMTFDFVGSQPGRWRITAMDQSGAHKSSVPSNWRGFDYTVLPVLPTPVLTAPADGAKFSNYPRTMTLAWQSVPGANQYLVEV